RFRGPCPLGLAGTPVDGMAIGIADRQAGNRHRLASTGIPAVWEMEEPPSRRPPLGTRCSRGAPPANQSRQPRLGRSAHCSGTVKARPAGVATVAKDRVRHRKPPSQHWRTFLKNHMPTLVSADFFVVRT